MRFDVGIEPYDFMKCPPETLHAALCTKPSPALGSECIFVCSALGEQEDIV